MFPKPRKIKFVPNSKHQKDFLQSIFDGTPITALCSGRQAGKTHVGAAAIPFVLLKMNLFKMGTGWVLTPSIKQTRAAKKSFKEIVGYKRMGGLIVRELKHENAFLLDLGPETPWHLKSGRGLYRVEFHTADNPDALRGDRVDWIWMDEAAYLPPETMDTVQYSLAISGGPMWMTTTPDGRNWFYDRVWLPAMEGQRNIKTIHAKSVDNPLMTKEKLARLGIGKGMDEAFRRQEEEAVFTHRQGLVYPMFKPEMIKDPPHGGGAEAPSHVAAGEVVAGLDPGANDPFCYLWVLKRGTSFYVVDEYYSTDRKTLQTHSINIRKSPWERRVARRWGDPGRAQDLLDLSYTYGLECFHARNQKAGPKGGINAVAVAFERGELFISPRCVNTIRELYNYIYKDKGEEPVDKDNHAMDALRYVIFNERNFTGENEVHFPHEGGYIEITDKYNDFYMPDGKQIKGGGWDSILKDPSI